MNITLGGVNISFASSGWTQRSQKYKSCRNGHVMQMFQVPQTPVNAVQNRYYICDICQHDIYYPRSMRGCRTCDYDVCNTCTAEQALMEKCLKGHELKFFNAPNEHYSCDLCERSIPLLERLKGCRTCNFDVCLSCIAKCTSAFKKEDGQETKQPLPVNQDTIPVPPPLSLARQNSEPGKNCTICFDEDANVAFIPCGHISVGEICAQQLHECPICRVHVQGRLRVFFCA